VALFGAALLAVAFKPKFNFVVSDGRGYYVYLPSLVIDGDLDFSNQIREHWDGDYHPPLDQWRSERGLVKNSYPAGVALTLAPSFLAGHAAARGCHALTGGAWCVPDGYSAPYQLFNLAFLLALGVAALALTDRLLTGAFGLAPVTTAAAVVAYWLGSHFLYYHFREPFMAHLAGTFWVTASVFLVWRLVEGLPEGRLSSWRLFLLAFSTSMALVCRPTNAFLLPFHVYLLAAILRHGLLVRLLRALPAALAGLTPLGVQMLIWKEIYGHFVVYSYDSVGFHWLEPAGWQTLFSSRHGLFFWSPLLLFAAGGVLWRVARAGRRAEPLLVCFVAAFLILWYCNSCWECWSFGDAFGGRAFLELTSFYVLGLAFAFEAVRRAGRLGRGAFATGLVVALLYNIVLMGLYISHRIPRDGYLL
jgi:hypothetical protein